jgi:hypothetical protein
MADRARSDLGGWLERARPPRAAPVTQRLAPGQSSTSLTLQCWYPCGRNPDRPLDSLLSVQLIRPVFHGPCDMTGRTMFTRRGPAVGPAGQRIELFTGPQDVRVPEPRTRSRRGRGAGGESRVGCVSACPAELVRESRPSGGCVSGRPAASPNSPSKRGVTGSNRIAPTRKSPGQTACDLNRTYPRNHSGNHRCMLSGTTKVRRAGAASSSITRVRPAPIAGDTGIAEVAGVAS